MSTSGSAWRRAREQGVEMLLPSGNYAALRPVEVDFFARVGHIPSALAPVVNDVLHGQERKLPDLSELADDNSELVGFLNQLVAFAFVNPKVVDTPQNEDELTVDDISYVDKVFVYRLFSYPAHVLTKFREIQSRNVPPVATATNNGSTGQHDVRDQPVGDPVHEIA